MIKRVSECAWTRVVLVFLSQHLPSFANGRPLTFLSTVRPQIMHNMMLKTSLIWPPKDPSGLKYRLQAASVKQKGRWRLSSITGFVWEAHLLSTGLFQAMKVENGDAIAQVVLDAQIGVRCPPLGGSLLNTHPPVFIYSLRNSFLIPSWTCFQGSKWYLSSLGF